MITNFCDKAQKVIALAESIAFDFGHSSVGSEHLLLSFLKNKDTKVKKLLESFDITYESVKNDLLTIFEKKDTLPFYMEYTPSFREILDNAIKSSKKLNEEKVSVEVLALSLFNQEDSLARELLEKYNCDFSLLNESLKVDKISPLDNIDELTNLNKKAMKNPTIIFKRDKEIDIICNTLLRKQKANALIVGEPGVGKSAIVEYLAYKIVNGDVVEGLKNKIIYELDISSIVAGTKYRGEFEEKLKKIIKKIKEEKNTIIFIDEIHNIIGAGGAEGAIDASNILKPYLARGEFKCIGATTYDEYVKVIEKEKAVDRRFQLIKIDEPDVSDCIDILRGIKGEYEKYHDIKISEEICKKIVLLSKKYVIDRHFPDKAIDILDFSCVRAKKNGSHELDEEAIIGSIEDLYSVEISKNKVAESLIGKLEEKIVGQEKAIEKIVNYISYIDKGLVDDNRPLGVYFFVGPSGVGKTELAKQISKLYFGKDDAYIKVNMTEFKEPHSIAKLIGTSPGYVGYENQTLLVDKIRNNPHSVVILDEIEKAHKDVINLFLNVFDEGYFYDSRKRKIDFTNSIIIMTSNIGSSKDDGNIGFVNSINDNEETIRKVKNYFSNEFINRIDAIVCFDSLNKSSCKKICLNYIDEYKKNVDFEFSEDILDKIVNSGDIKKYGARFIKREIKRSIFNLIGAKVETF